MVGTLGLHEYSRRGGAWGHGKPMRSRVEPVLLVETLLPPLPLLSSLPLSHSHRAAELLAECLMEEATKRAEAERQV